MERHFLALLCIGHPENNLYILVYICTVCVGLCLYAEMMEQGERERGTRKRKGSYAFKNFKLFF